MSLYQEINQLTPGTSQGAEVLDQVKGLLDKYPEVQAIGIEGYTVLPDTDHLLSIQADTGRVLLSIWTKIEGHATKTRFLGQLKDLAPWLMPHVPNWLKEEDKGHFISSVEYVVIMSHFNEVAFKNPEMRANYLTSPTNRVENIMARLRYGVEVVATTPSGSSKLTLRMGGYSVTRVLDEEGTTSIIQMVSRADIRSGGARRGFPRSAVEIHIKPDNTGGVTIAVNHPDVKVELADPHAFLNLI